MELGGQKVHSVQGEGRGVCRLAWQGWDMAAPALGPLLGCGADWGRAGDQDSAECPTCPLSSPPQGCPEAQPGLQAQETSSAAGPRCPQRLPLPHGLQRGPAAVATPYTPLPAQGRLQG